MLAISVLTSNIGIVPPFALAQARDGSLPGVAMVVVCKEKCSVSFADQKIGEDRVFAA